jgi:hypothetical protein
MHLLTGWIITDCVSGKALLDTLESCFFAGPEAVPQSVALKFQLDYFIAGHKTGT